METKKNGKRIIAVGTTSTRTLETIMTKYNSAYGVKNRKNGVEFYFDIQEAKS